MHAHRSDPELRLSGRMVCDGGVYRRGRRVENFQSTDIDTLLHLDWKEASRAMLTLLAFLVLSQNFCPLILAASVSVIRPDCQ